MQSFGIEKPRHSIPKQIQPFSVNFKTAVLIFALEIRPITRLWLEFSGVRQGFSTLPVFILNLKASNNCLEAWRTIAWPSL